MNDLEKENFAALQGELLASIRKGVEFVRNPPPPKA